MKPSRQADYFLAIGVSMVLFYAVSMLTSAILFFTHTPVSSLHLFLSFFFSLSIAAFLFGWPPGRTIAAFVSCAAILAASYLVSSWFIDLSWDGQSYHGESIIQLAAGWNPVTDPPISDHLSDKADRLSIWMNYYPKGEWTNAALILMLTGSLEGAKSWNLFLAVAAAFLALSFLMRISEGKPLLVFAIAILAVLNPVVICQSMSLYVDMLVYLFFLSLICCLGHYLLGGSRAASLAGIGSCIIALSNIKLTGLFFALALCGIFLAIVTWKRGFKESLLPGLAFSGFFAVTLFVVGYNPYITCLIEHHNPLYIVMVPRLNLAVSHQVDKLFLHSDNIAKMTYSLLSNSANVFYSIPPLKTPFTFNLDELAVFKDTDVRFGGFGPMFGGALLLALTVWFAVTEAAYKTDRDKGAPGGETRFWMVAVVTAIFTTSVAVGEGWWARYAAQIWLLPLVPLTGMVSLPAGTGRFGKLAAIALVQILVINVVVVGEIYYSHQYKFTGLAREQQEKLIEKSRNEKIPFYFSPDFRITAKYKLLSQKINFSEVADIKECAAPEDLVGSWGRVKACKTK